MENLNFDDIRGLQNAKKEDIDKIINRYGKMMAYKHVIPYTICISPNHVDVLYNNGLRSNLTYVEQRFDSLLGQGWYMPDDIDLADLTKYFASYFQKRHLKRLTKQIFDINRKINPWLEVDKILDIARPYIDYMNYNIVNVRHETLNGQSYRFGKYIVSLMAIDYSTRNTTKHLFRSLKYQDLVWKAIDGLDTYDILFTYHKWPKDDMCIDRIKDSIVNTRKKGYMETGIELNAKEEIEMDMEENINMAKENNYGLYVNELSNKLKPKYLKMYGNKI